jgi:hypothetical protein
MHKEQSGAVCLYRSRDADAGDSERLELFSSAVAQAYVGEQRRLKDLRDGRGADCIVDGSDYPSAPSAALEIMDPAHHALRGSPVTTTSVAYDADGADAKRGFSG